LLRAYGEGHAAALPRKVMNFRRLKKVPQAPGPIPYHIGEKLLCATANWAAPLPVRVNRYTFSMLGGVRFTPVSDRIVALRAASVWPDLPIAA